MKTEILYQKIIRVPAIHCRDFSTRLNFVMLWRDYSSQELAQQLYVGRSTMRGYLTGHRMPDLDTLTHIAIILDVSTDFLLGLSDYVCTD